MNTRLILQFTARRAVVAALAFSLINSAGAAGLVEVTQTIFGMDCAPCAHGVQKGLMKLDGVQNATVSLNDGYAKVNLVRDNSVTLEQIREVIRNNGFTPKAARLIVTGQLSRADNQPALKLANRRFSLVASPDAQAAWQKVQTLAPDAAVAIEGRVEESDATRIAVLAIRAAE